SGRRTNCVGKPETYRCSHVPQWRGFTDRRSRDQRGNAPSLGGGSQPETIYGRISLPNSGEDHRSRHLGVGGSQSATVLSCPRQRAVVSLATRPTHRGALAAVESENRARLPARDRKSTRLHSS